MLGTHVHRYIFREILSPTLLCLVIFTMVMVLGRAFKLVDLIIDKGVALSDILVLLGTLLPALFSITLPLAFLMGIMVGLGRMSADSETVALKSAGVGLGAMSVPVFTLAIVFVLLTGATNLWLKPWGSRAFEKKSFEIARQKATIGFQPRIFMKQFNNLVLYANEVNSRAGELTGLFIVEKKPEATSLVFADSGRVLVDEATETLTIRLKDGVIHRQQAQSLDNYQLVHFRSYDIQPDMELSSAPAERTHRKPKELSTMQLWKSTSTDQDQKRAQELQAELHWRLSSSLAPVLFVLFGLPFSLQSNRSGRSSGFVMGLIIFLVYYFVLSTASTLTKDVGTSPWLTYWAVHATLAVMGIIFLRQSSLERPNILVVWVDQAIRTLQKRARKHVNA